MLERCHHTGHCLHRGDDGAVFVRHSQLPRGKVPVTCCWCEKKAELEGYAKNTTPPAPSSYVVREHGPFQVTPEGGSPEDVAVSVTPHRALNIDRYAEP